ncbi:YegP family protein [Rhodococcus sp. LB1]|nr:DUF1508 domain-containing protein [Rhodococcus sp. LB1]
MNLSSGTIATNRRRRCIAARQGYTSKAAAQNGIASIKDNAASAPNEDLT